MTEAPVVTLTIVLHNSEHGLSACIEAVRPELEDGFAELVAVDNASPDTSVDLLRREAPTAKLVTADRNRGFAGGANLGWPHARGRYWMLLNPDVVLEAGGLRSLAEWMDAHPSIGLASAELSDPTGGGLRSAGRAVPSAWRALLEGSRLHRLLTPVLRGRVLRGAYWTGGDQLDAGWVPGTALIVRREAIESTGLLDERFFLYGEDIEWCGRMRRAGWGVGVCSAVRARHDGSASARETFGADETSSRMVAGEIDAVRVLHGDRYARRYARATALALKLEAIAPGRSREQRERIRAAAHTWRSTIGTES
jgi:GT2 family glycosyltransferase